MNDPLRLLAEHLSGHEVVQNSICLAMPVESMLRKRADHFFALRKAFGVHGYVNVTEAFDAINNTLAQRALKGSV